MKLTITYYPPEEGEKFAKIDKAIEHAANDPTLWRMEKKSKTEVITVVYTTKMRTREGLAAVHNHNDYLYRRSHNGAARTEE